MKCELFIGVCCTQADFIKNKNRIKKSIDNLACAFNYNCNVLIVIQNKSFSTISLRAEKYHIEVQYENELNVSNARNICIEKALHYNSKYTLFHDASIYWSKNAANFINFNKGNTPKVNVIFNNNLDNIDLNYLNSSIKKINPIYEPFVWSYLFNTKDISELHFDTNFGPGENTRYKSGEDVIFLFDFFERKKNNQIVVPNENVYVYHPPRESDYSKHLLYAEGQGKMFRVLIKKHPSIRIYLDLCLFFGNGIYRLLLCRKNSHKILYKRLNGFWKG
ncbi:hypothetical protein KYI78_12040 [Providencia rettgeri]|nr:hypothetical protein [Providencia sp. PROV156]MBW3105952.1 hypothetical protein [Providencia rettgeri]BBU98261.1 hypothetical protein BML2496_41440 [Providencia rettgeri]